MKDTLNGVLFTFLPLFIWETEGRKCEVQQKPDTELKDAERFRQKEESHALIRVL